MSNYTGNSNSYTAGNNYSTGGSTYPTGSNSYGPTTSYPTGTAAAYPTGYPASTGGAPTPNNNLVNNFLGNSNQNAPTPLSDFNAHLTNIDAFLGHYPWVMQAEQKTGIRRAYLMLITLGLMSLTVLWSHGSDALCNLVGFVYPMYASFKALKTPIKDDDTEWLTYWVVYGFCTLVEDFCNSIFEETSWSTIYFCAKIVFLLWLYLPQTKGSNMVFKTVVEPILSKYESQIDREVDKGENAAAQFGQQIQNDPNFQQNQTLLKAGAQSVAIYGYDALGRPSH